MINQEQSDWSALGTRLSDIFKERADKVVFVEGAEEVPFAEVARAIDIMRGAGIDHVGLIAGRDNVQRGCETLRGYDALLANPFDKRNVV